MSHRSGWTRRQALGALGLRLPAAAREWIGQCSHDQEHH
jgi:hypothetical protein